MHHQKPIRFKIIIEGETMSQVTGTYSITTSSVLPSTLAITPSTGDEGPFPVGQAITPVVIATVSGGVTPYAYQVSGFPSGTGYELNEGPSADGVTGDVDLTLSGTPTAADATASPETLTVVVTDSAGASATLTKKLA
jgi:hypothetical protein